MSNSGATPWYKGDVSGKDVLIECKTKVAPSKQVTIHKEWLTGIKREAIAMRKSLAAVVFDFGDGENYAIISERDFMEYLKLREEEE